MTDYIEDKACEFVGKTIKAIYDHKDREAPYMVRDLGILIEFTDGTELKISAAAGQNYGYLVGI